jgi:hypothetical protein
MRTRVICRLAVVTSIACLGLSASAFAFTPAGDRTFQQTYPVASGLCSRVSAGTESGKLKHYAATVSTYCATLESSFAAAQTEVVTVRKALRAKVAVDEAAITTACPAVSPTPTPPPTPTPACVQARLVNNASIAALRSQIRTDARSYYRKAESARHHFWTAIHALPGESHLPADAPIPLLSS